MTVSYSGVVAEERCGEGRAKGRAKVDELQVEFALSIG